jgi:hypothetical protein
MQPKFTRVEGASIVMKSCANCGLETGFEEIIGHVLEPDFWITFDRHPDEAFAAYVLNLIETCGSWATSQLQTHRISAQHNLDGPLTASSGTR